MTMSKRTDGSALRIRGSGVVAIALCFLSLLTPLGAQQTVLVEVGENWAYLKGTLEPNPDWMQIDFDDATWLVGPSGFGYADGDDATTLSDMQNAYGSLYIRKVFNVASIAGVEQLALLIDYDDGFVAYLNGMEVARMGLADSPPAFDALATGHEAGTVERFDILPSALNVGENVLAIQGHNTSLGSTDFSLIPRLVANPDLCPLADGLTCVFDLGTGSVDLTWINEIDYDSIAIYRNDELLAEGLPGADNTFTDPDPVEGVESTYRVVATSSGVDCAGLDCSVYVEPEANILMREGDEWAYFKGDVAPPVDWMAPGFDDALWLHGATGIGYGTIATKTSKTVLDDMQEDTALVPPQPGYAAIFCRATIDIDTFAGFDELLLSILYDDGLVVYLNGTELGRANMLAGAVTYTTFADGTATEPSYAEFTITKDLLLVGTNTVAVSVHNSSLTSSDLAFVPALLRVGATNPETPRFRRGDVDNNAQVNMTDPISLLNHLYLAGPAPACADAADSDDSGNLTLTDAILVLNHLFRAGPAPQPPGLTCGIDPTDDALGNCETTGCAP